MIPQFLQRVVFAPVIVNFLEIFPLLKPLSNHAVFIVEAHAAQSLECRNAAGYPIHPVQNQQEIDDSRNLCEEICRASAQSLKEHWASNVDQIEFRVVCLFV